MTGIRFFAVSVVTFVGLSGWTLADTPVWLPTRQSADQIVEPAMAVSAEPPASERLRPEGVFSGSGESLIRVSQAGPDCECCEGMDAMCAPGHTPTWVKFTPYAWATAVKGNMTVNGVTVPMNIDLSDLWQLLTNGEVRGGFMGNLQFGRDNWSLFINGDIVSMDPSAEVRRARIETGLTMTLLELGGAVDIFNANEDDPANSPLRIQMLGGVRYYSVDVSAILSLPQINPLVQIAQGEQWVDLFVGSQAVARLSTNTSAFVRGDVGGFGIGSSSNHAWNLATGFSTKGIWGSSLVLGYRLFDLNQSLGGGAGSSQGFGVDELIHGPVIGLTFQF